MEIGHKEELGPECDQDPMEKAGGAPGEALEEGGAGVAEVAEGEGKDAFTYSDGGPASQSEAEQQVEQWNREEQTILEPQGDTGKT